jgi:hypothetical protein
MSHLEPVFEKAKAGQLALLVGRDLPSAVTGVPSNSQLAHDVASEFGLPASDSLAMVAQNLTTHHWQHKYLGYLERVLPTGGEPGSLHKAVAALRVLLFLTAAYDDRLARALEAAGRPANLLIEDSDLQRRQFDRPDLIKLCGDVGRRRTLVVAKDEYDDLTDWWKDDSRRELFDRWVRESVSEKTVLLVGCDPAERSDFEEYLYWMVLDRLGAFGAQSYLVWTNPAADDVTRWGGRSVTVIDDEPVAFLESLAEELAGVQVEQPPDKEMTRLKGLLQMLRGTPTQAQVEAQAATVPDTARLKSIRMTFNFKLSAAGELRTALDVNYDPDIDDYDGEFRNTGITLEQLQEWNNEAAKRRRKWKSPQNSPVEDKGLEFFDAILPPGSEERRTYAHALYLDQTFADALYIVFDLEDKRGRLSPVPWELLHDGHVHWEHKIRGRGFLGLKYPVYRRLPTVSSPGQVAGRIEKALVVAADPTQRLDELEAEAKWLVGELEKIGVEVDVRGPDHPEVNDPEAIKDLIRNGGYHLLHFTGHGQFDANDPPQSHMVLGLPGEPNVKLTATALAEAGRKSGLTLVFLSACELGGTAEQDEDRPWEEDGLVDALMQSGIPAAIGMRWKIGDENGHKLALTFYKGLLSGQPIELALMNAREAVEDEPDWANPVLTKRHGVL